MGKRFLIRIIRTIPPSQLGEPFYEGSVQKLYEFPGDPSLMITQTTDRGSVFDVGALFTIPGQDVNRAVFRHLLYSQMGRTEIWDAVAGAIGQEESIAEDLRRELLVGELEGFRSFGARTHHAGMLDAVSGEVAERDLPKYPSPYNVVRRFKILKPSRVVLPDGASLFDYTVFRNESGFVVPLEFIVRFGITSASSIFRKYQRMDAAAQKVFGRELGATGPLQAWQLLARPITDFTTKFEPADRMLSKQEALVTCSLPGPLFRRGIKLSILGAWAARQLISPLGIKLWDIKWEFAFDGSDLVFVDTIDTDSFRATLEVTRGGRRYLNHCNKQAVRDYFHLFHGDWIEAINESKRLGQEEGIAFTEILAAGQNSGSYPKTPRVAESFIVIQKAKMDAIRDYLTGNLGADAAASLLLEIGLKELAFYDEAGKLEDFAAINAI